jgi:hypothetical protein
MWRALLCLLDFNETTYARDLNSFGLKKSTIQLQYDASLEGIGFMLHDITQRPVSLIAIAGWHFPFCLNHESKHQNAAEFIAVLVGLMSLVRMKVPCSGIHLIGDNQSSLKWSDTERFKGNLALRASIMFIATCIKFNIEVVTVEHVAGVDNVICDHLSRGIAPTDLGYHENILTRDEYAIVCMSLADPTIPMTSMTDVFNLWNNTNKIITWSHVV